MYASRKRLYSALEDERKSKVIAYVTGDRRGLETKISAEVIDFFTHHLDTIGDVPKISLFLYTRGGDTLAAWSVTNLIRQFCKTYEVIVPFKAHSAGTLICLGASTILMTKQASLGPIDPSVNTQLNPQIPGAPAGSRFPVSVEAISAFLEFAKSELNENENRANVIMQLSTQVHPLVLGQAYRSRGQIRMLAEKLLRPHVKEDEKLKKILGFLCSDSGSHDYTIDRREAREEIGLAVEKPTPDSYRIIKAIYDDLAEELQLTSPYDPGLVVGANQQAAYSFPRAFIESIDGGSHVFTSEGTIHRQQVQIQPGVLQEALSDQRSFEGWKYENA